jgi:hypothetical protein
MLLPLSAERAGAKGPTLGTPFPLPLRRIYPSSSSQSNALSRRLSEKKPVYQSIVAVGPMPDDNAYSLLSNLRLRNHTETNDGQAP